MFENLSTWNQIYAALEGEWAAFNRTPFLINISLCSDHIYTSKFDRGITHHVIYMQLFPSISMSFCFLFYKENML